MTVTLDLPSELEQHLTQEAQKNGVPLSDYLQSLVQNTIEHRPGAASARVPRPNREAMLALLDDLANTDKYGTAEEQRQSLEYLRKAIDADRPGQHSIFGEGYNPE